MKTGNKKLLLILGIICAGIWVYNAFQLKNVISPGEDKKGITNNKKLKVFNESKYSYSPDFKDPFLNPYLKISTKAVKKGPITPPPFKIGGINWNASNPVVLLQGYNGESNILKEGDILRGLIIKKIYKDSVIVEYLSNIHVLKPE